MGFGHGFLDGCIVCSDLATAGTFGSVLLQLQSSRSAEGISLQTLLAVVSARVLHLGSQCFGIHYRPVLLPGAFFAGMDVANAAAGVGCVVLFAKHWSSYQVDSDNFGIVLFDRLGLVPKSGPLSNRAVLAAVFLYAVILVLALLWSCVRQSTGSWLMSYYCCVYEAICTVALLPQLWMFHKDKWVNQLLGTFVVMVALNRLCTLTFWLTYTWVNPYSAPANRYIQICIELLNLAVLGDFLYYFVRAKLRGEKRIKIGSWDAEV